MKPKILVPVDLSDATMPVCKAARDLAQLKDAELVLVHVVIPPIVMHEYVYSTTETMNLLRLARKRAMERLEALGHWMRKSCPDTRVVQHTGPVIATLLRTIARVKPDYIVLGSHGHTAAYDLIVGSTTHGLLRKASCPVLVVPIPRKAKRKATPAARNIAELATSTL